MSLTENYRYKATRLPIAVSLVFAALSQPCTAVENTVEIGGALASTSHVLVKFTPEVREQRGASALNRLGLRAVENYRFCGVTLAQMTPQAAPLKETLAALEASSIVEYAEPDYVQTIDRNLPDDPRFGELWGMDNSGQTGGTPDADIDAPEAWSVRTGAPDLVVGVIDTGVDYDHEDLADNMWRNPGEIPGNGIDDDANGYVDDVYGIDTVNDDADPDDDDSHGTHVAGTIGAVGDNGLGVTGVAWDVQIMALKAFDEEGSGFTSDAIECIEYATMMRVDHGIDIRLTNNSWGGGIFSQALKDAVEASGDAGMLFVAAAGNNGSDNDRFGHYPASFDSANVVAVAATDHNDALSGFSNYGLTGVDLGAPGDAILSTFPDNDYASLDGTSMATPHVAGALAVLWGEHPDYTATQAKDLLLNTVDPIPDLTGRTLTGGRLNLNEMLTCDPDDPRLRIWPAEGFAVEMGQPSLVTGAYSACAPLTGASLVAAFDNGEPSLPLLDNGTGPDLVADDGVYSGLWTPPAIGPVTVEVTATAGEDETIERSTGEIVPFSGYVFDDTEPFAWRDISTTGTPVLLADDDYATIDLPFLLAFFDQRHNTLTIGSNGLAYFVEERADFANQPIPMPSPIDRFIAPMWDDWNPEAGGNILWEIQGEPGQRALITQWDQVPHFPAEGAVSFQFIYEEQTGSLVFQYLDVDDGGVSATVGVQRDGTYGQQYSFDAPSLDNEMAIRWTRGVALEPDPCDLNEDAKFGLKDLILFATGCKDESATWECDRNADGQYNLLDLLAFYSECS